jgi:hypothetical protein
MNLSSFLSADKRTENINVLRVVKRGYLAPLLTLAHYEPVIADRRASAPPVVSALGWRTQQL